MLLIPCPYCGLRNQIEFTYGGDATLKRPSIDAHKPSGSITSTCATTQRSTLRTMAAQAAGVDHGSSTARQRERTTFSPVHSSTRNLFREQPFRLPDGRSSLTARKPPRLRIRRCSLQGYAGDTLASGTAANGVHSSPAASVPPDPRGIFSAGTEEPNAMVQLGHKQGARTEPNVRANHAELYEGLTATSQNCWPSVRFDIGAINNAVSRLIPAGFYYKTFMWPPTPRWWLKYEHAIRRAAGMGRAASEPDPDHYEHRYAHCDVLVIGGGATGLSAARAAAHAGARVIVCDEGPWWGGGLLDGEVDARPA